MEVRCGGCNKLFRIPDEKITGKGIKFSCTRCHETVKVTREEFERYTLPKSSAAVLDRIEEKTKPAAVQAPTEEKAVPVEPDSVATAEDHIEPAAPVSQFEAQTQPAEEYPQMPETTAVPEQKEFEHGTSSVSAIPREEQSLPAAEREPSFEHVTAPEPASEPVQPPEPSASEFQPEQVQQAESSRAELTSEKESEPAIETKVKLERIEEKIISSEQKQESQPQQQEPVMVPEQSPTAEPAPVLKPAVPEPIVEAPRQEKEQKPEPERQTRQAKASHGSLVTPAIPKHEPAPYATSPTIRSVPVAPETPSRSVNRFLVYTVILVIIGMIGYGVYTYMGHKTQKREDLLKELSSTEGLHISSASGNIDSNGDLLIKCVIENSLDRERPVWYVVVDIYSAQGSLLGRIRSINGKQMYTQRDYDILSKRGMNIQELKAKNLEDQGVTIPPKGSVTFELKYVQPLSGAASVTATVSPFDPIRMFKELAEEIQQ